MESEVYEMNLEDKIIMLEAKLAAAIQAQEYSHANLMILERDRQKAWEENKILREKLNGN
jgi:hypothetical protein